MTDEVLPSLSAAARSVWAKSLDEQGNWLPLWQHMDDAADVARLLFDRWLAPSLMRFMACEFDDSVDDARTAVTFLAGIHDLGKATPAFAVQDGALAQRMRNHGLYMAETKAQLVDRNLAHHAVAGHHLLIRWLVGRGWPRSTARSWGVVLGGHHGVPPDPDAEQAARPAEHPSLYGEGLWESVQTELADRVASRTWAAGRLGDWQHLRLSQQFQVLATGLVIISDWIASNVDLFPFLSGELPEADDQTSRAEVALEKLRLPPPWRVPERVDDADKLFATRFALPDRAMPRPVQRVAADIARQMPEPGLLIVEAPMGEGKTEAALAAAEVMARRWGAGGLFVALPTQATTDAMFVRVVDWLDRMGANAHDVGGSITLSHGKARFNPLFEGMVAAGRLRDIDPDQPRGPRRRHTSHRVLAHSWLSGRKKAHLANFTIGTIDQLLFAGLKSRHLMLRHLGLAGKVVLLDEIHAYDAYMNSYLTTVLTWLGAYRVPVIALSATLPGDRRRALVEAYQARRDLADDAAVFEDLGGDIGYPVLTWTSGSDASARIAPASGRRTTVHLDVLADDLDVLVHTLQDALAEGGCALVVRNTVRRVLAAAERLEAAFPGEVTVAHSRFLTGDRLRKDAELLARFGPGAVGRPRRHVVVASQVVEQSLDVDFDLLVTDLAPVDLVLQRMGRLHRHERGEAQGERPPQLRRARAYVTGGDLTQHPPQLEDTAAKYVYGEHALLRSAAVLAPRFSDRIQLPDDIAPLVQDAYGPTVVGPESWQEAMRDAAERWKGRTERRESKARDFQIAPPGRRGKAIVGWVAASVGETDDESQGQGQVRDGAPTLEAILVQCDDGGQWHTPAWLADGAAGLPVPRDNMPPDEVARAMSTCAIRLPLDFSNAESEEALWEATPEAWESSPIIYRLPVVVVDGDGWGAINDRRVRYTAAKGLEVFRHDE